ncbi:hypothetical protein BTO06_03910 [Tenacibaculum sp. SZ-18]|uniref:hypothetical protein n=1 Tax=Tenacibaculum sp. SZ-18 TaxID=754423 RepID=UPI000C2D042A|nr:hypothetical protein [Tenacibaculum sp. SZ-18]AUC14337.1 hypothetical protein BTO06_03910 [Tenacibaculum sp. SZ-18]
MIYFAKSQQEEYQTVLRKIGYMFSFVGAYFLILIFFPKKVLLDSFGIRDFHRIFYYASMIILSVSSGLIFASLQKVFMKSEEKLKNLIRNLFDFILIDSVEKDYVKDSKISEYREESLELVKNALDNE